MKIPKIRIKNCYNYSINNHTISMIRKKEIPYHQDFLIRAFADQIPEYERPKISLHIEKYQKTNQNNKKGLIKR